MSSPRPSYSMRSAQPSMYSSKPSRFCLKWARLPQVVPYLKPSLSWRTSMRSPRICIVPWVSSTLPSKMASCLASSRVTRSASRLIGFSRSAFSADAGAVSAQASAHAKRALRSVLRSTPARITRCLIRVIRSPHVRQQLDHPSFVVHFQPLGRDRRCRVGDGYRPIGPGEVVVGHDVQKGRAHHQLARLAVGGARHAHVVLEIDML